MPFPPRTHPYTKPRVLIGEGRDEVNFFEALLAHLGVTDVQVEDYAGKGNLSIYLREFGIRPGRQNVLALGITRDADANVTQVFQSIGTLLSNNGLPVPTAAGQIASGPPRVGVFILPDNQRTGMLEDLCLDSVQSDPAFPCLASFFQCVFQSSNRQPNNTAKANVHAWLASQIDPELRLGEAAKQGYWPWKDKAYHPLIQFLQSF